MRGNIRRAGTPRGEPIASEGKALEGKAQGRSDASASGGLAVMAARGVVKPRTWPAAAEGSAANEAEPSIRQVS